MNRRKFFGLAAAGTAALAVVPTIGITGCSTSWIAVAEKDAPILVNIAETVVAVVASLTGNPELTPVALALIQEAVAIFSAGIKTLSDAITAYKASAGTSTWAAVVAAMNAVEEEAPNVIKAITQAPGGIVSVITSAIGIAISLISAIQSLLPASVTTGNKVAVAPAQRVKVANVTLPDSSVLKSNFNAVLSVYGYGKFQVQ